MKILVLGASARAVAQSVARAGHEAVAMDSYGDCDLKEIARWHRRDKSEPLGEIVKEFDVDGAVFASGVENRPEAIIELEEAGVRVYSSPYASIKRCRSLNELEKFCADCGLSRPKVFLPQAGDDLSGFSGFLIKRFKSGGGIGVRDCDKDTALREGEYLQERIGGTSISVVFLADGKNAALCGASRQLIGNRALGADGFAWCGNIMPFSAEAGKKNALLDEFRRVASAMASYFGLKGAIGADFIYDGVNLWLLEINPRISASFELVELLSGVNIFSLHLSAISGHLPPERENLLDGPFRGKGIIYAPKNLTAPDTGAWYNYSRRDIPQPRASLPAGAPICTSITPPLPSDADVMAYLSGEAVKVWRDCGL